MATVRFTIVCLLLITISGCQQKSYDGQLFTQISSNESNVDFNNTLNETPDFNIIEYLYFYNGGGVALGDINNDGLSDIYFSSNQGTNKLYLNKGGFHFQDITEQAGVAGVGNWKTGVAFADINADGWLDIFVCGVGGYKKFDGRNQVFLNQGNQTFKNATKDLGLEFQGFSTQVAFLDYDLDGDLDIYLLNHSVHSVSSYGKASLREQGNVKAGDKLYENQLVPSGTTSFKEVTTDAGIYTSQIGYGLGVGVSDINKDGWPDIYVSNDFHENDYLYLNNKDKTFKQVVEKSLGHTSRFSMGNDIADINNDGLVDVVSLDMLPNDESVIKTSAGEDTYEIFKFKLSYNYNPQVTRNCLQLNRFISDSSVLFSDIAMLAGVGATDWSWSPLLADFDQDGYKDLFIANGIWRRPNDLDYINFISDSEKQAALQSIEEKDLKFLEMMPSGKVSNFLFKNSGNLSFEDVTVASGLSVPSLSNGAAYGDLDNDGDLDLVVNTLNEKALLYRNNTQHDSNHSFVKFTLKGPSENPFGIGTKIIVYSDTSVNYQEAYFVRGFSSSIDPMITVGLGASKLDSIQVIWPDKRAHVILNPKLNSLMTLDHSKATLVYDYYQRKSITLLQSIEPAHLPDYVHVENTFSAFSTESLIPHALTNEGPPMAVGDLNNDGLDDVFIGGGDGKSSRVFLQDKAGSWKDVSGLTFRNKPEVIDAAFFDADNDNDLDLVFVSGGQEAVSSNALAPQLYLNNGKGSFSIVNGAFGNLLLNASCIKPFDYDQDGDIDLFIGASVMPQLYGMSPMSFLLNNDGTGNFTPNMQWLGRSQFDNPTHVRPGMIKDAVWSHVDQDSLIDLILVGEWMPITVLIQQSNHTFSNQTIKYNLQPTHGWWNSITSADFDGDGDDDWMVGNLGLNCRLKASADKPVKMYLGDFDSNGGSDHIIVYFNGDQSYPFASRDQLIKQIPSLKKKFLQYKDYRDVKLEDIITPVQKGNSAVMQVEMLESVFLENTGTGIKLSKLPIEAQMSPIFAMCTDDINGDGYLDVILGGNLSEAQPDLGPHDASYGLILLGDGKNQWKAVSTMDAGLVVKGEVRSIQKVKSPEGAINYFFARNNNSIVGFKKTKK